MLASYWSRAFRDQLAVKIHRLIAPFHRTSSVPSLELPVNNTFHVNLSFQTYRRWFGARPSNTGVDRTATSARVSTHRLVAAVAARGVLPRDPATLALAAVAAPARAAPSSAFARARVAPRAVSSSRARRVPRRLARGPKRPLRVAASCAPRSSALAVRAAAAGFASVVRAAAKVERGDGRARHVRRHQPPRRRRRPGVRGRRHPVRGLQLPHPLPWESRGARSSSRNPATASRTTCSSSWTSARTAAA